ncbi:MAG TPA: coproporphyrinogen-III oxidase family protein [Pyrinomonadaceae bacterium]|jgi:oxygen-independent coproporphyrinogen-3 oxidase
MNEQTLISSVRINELAGLSPDPYPRKCYLPFILYPPAMRRNEKGHQFILENVDMQKDGSDFVLYLSVPFCRVRCKACPYFINVLPENDRRGEEDRYVAAMIKDIAHWASYRKWRTGRLRAIYLGGGTGSLLKTESLRRIVDAVFEHFTVADDYCFTLEGNARDFDEEKIDYVASSKITRLSLGVQSFQPDVLQIIGSPHAAEESIRVIRAFQQRGFFNIQLDLMFNMPEHTLDVWRRDLADMMALNIPHFTVYLYRIHTDTPQDKLIRNGRVRRPLRPDSHVVKEMKRELRETAAAHGYVQYMVDHFCQPGFENKYNEWSWKIYTDALAIGPGAYSYFEGYRLGTAKDVDDYVAHVERGEFLISTIGDRMDERVERERYIIFTLLFFNVEFAAYRAKFATDFREDFGPVIERLLRKGLVTLDEREMRLTELGVEWHSNVLLEFFNARFWADEDAMNEPNWSMNIPMVELSTQTRRYWLGD